MQKLFPAFLLILALALPAQAFNLALHDAPAEVYFSPRGGAQDALVQRIEAAAQSVHVLAYSFTSRPLAEALGRASARGVAVLVVLDRSQRTAKGGQAQALAASGCTVWTDRQHAIAHNKIMIFDGQAVALGSYNFTASAEERNAENLLLIDSPDLARLYLDDWEKHRAHAERL